MQTNFFRQGSAAHNQDQRVSYTNSCPKQRLDNNSLLPKMFDSNYANYTSLVYCRVMYIHVTLPLYEKLPISQYATCMGVTWLLSQTLQQEILGIFMSHVETISEAFTIITRVAEN